MAEIRYFQGLPLYDPDDNLFDALNGVTPTATTTDITYRNTVNGNVAVFHGTFTLDGGGNVTGGTISGFDVSAGITPVMSATGYALSATAFAAAVGQFPLSAAFGRMVYADVTQTGTAQAENLSGYSGAIFGKGGDDSLSQLYTNGDPIGFMVMKGGKGDDTIGGGDNPTGSDLYGGMGNDNLRGGDATSTMHGGKGDDELQASQLAPSALYGGGGDDVLFDGFSPAVMNGGKGDDIYWLTNVGLDYITNFNVKHDVIGLNILAFNGVFAGTVTDAQFLRGTAATTAEQRILYDPASGNAFYDADGSGGTAPVLFASLPAHLKMHAHNFFGVD